MSGAALEVPAYEEIAAVGTPVLLRQQAAEVLAAHRSRRQRAGVNRAGVVGNAEATVAGPSRSQLIASRVTERYAQTPSYRAFLAAEAEEATKKARAAAEVAARSAEAVAAAQEKLLAELAMAEAQASAVSEHYEETVEQDSWDFEEVGESFEEQPIPSVRGGLTIRLFEDTAQTSRSLSGPVHSGIRAEQRFEVFESDETRALDEEISFRQSPTFDLEQASVPIPGNLLEFPRQLVAARKARPSYALGPLGEAEQEAQGGKQLRIFEVDAAEITSAPPVESSAPEWSSIWLDALTEDVVDEVVEHTQEQVTLRIEAASFERRIMASAVDACLIGMGFVLFATAFAYNTAELPSARIAGMSGAGVLVGMILLYHMLFFTLSEATPGMRYARIGLCTFDDENPMRSALLRRVFATLLAACPLGLGILWACVDEDGVGWHDRMSGMYQRSY